jgi:hypothetical protein
MQPIRQYERLLGREDARASLKEDDYWRRLGSGMLKAALVAVIGVLLRELVLSIEGHRRSEFYDDEL